jgi:hypothetical protein
VEFFPTSSRRTCCCRSTAAATCRSTSATPSCARWRRPFSRCSRRSTSSRRSTGVTLAGTGNLSGQDLAEDVIGTINLEFARWNERRRAVDILAEIERRTAGIAGISVESRKDQAGPPRGKPIDVQLSSRYPELLEPAVVKLREAMGHIAGLAGVEDTRPIPGIEWQIDVDRAKAARYGVDVTGVGNVIQLITLGLKFADYRPDYSDDEIDIVARFPDAYRNIDELDRLRVSTNDGLVPISNFVTRAAKPKVNTINRIDGMRVLSVKADVAPGVLADEKIREIKAWVASANLDPRINVAFKGQDEDQQKAGVFLMKAFAVALFLMAIILITQFNSFYSSAVILFAVVMSTIGVMIGLLIIDQPFGIVMSGIGVIALAGIVVNHKHYPGRDLGQAAPRSRFAARGHPAHLRSTAATGDADDDHGDPGTPAHGVPRQYRFRHARDHGRRAFDAVVDAALLRYRVWPRLRYRIDARGHTLRADGPPGRPRNRSSMAGRPEVLADPQALQSQSGRSRAGREGRTRQGRGVNPDQPKLRRAVRTRATVVSQHRAAKI